MLEGGWLRKRYRDDTFFGAGRLQVVLVSWGIATPLRRLINPVTEAPPWGNDPG